MKNKTQYKDENGNRANLLLLAVGGAFRFVCRVIGFVLWDCVYGIIFGYIKFIFWTVQGFLNFCILLKSLGLKFLETIFGRDKDLENKKNQNLSA